MDTATTKPTKVGIVPSKFSPRGYPFKYLQQFELVSVAHG